MPLIRSRLPSGFKIATVPIGAWMIVGLTYFWPAENEAAQTALAMIRSSALLVAVPGTLYVAGVLLFLQLQKVSHAK